MTLIRKLCLDLGSGIEEADKLISSVTVTLTDTHSEREVRKVTLAVSIRVQGLACTDLQFPAYICFFTCIYIIFFINLSESIYKYQVLVIKKIIIII